MASIDLEYNSGFQIYNSDDTPFHDLVLHKCTYETVVMSLGDKISGILYYKDNALDVTMSEYIIYKGVRYTLVNPPTILREGLVSDNSELRGMTKYSFTFYHPMYVLNNFPFSDIAVQSGQSRYLSQNKTFSWIGTLVDFVAKLNKNLEDTQWMVTIGNVTQEEQTKLSEVLSFDKNTIAEALKRGYETWEVPYVVDQLTTSSPYYPEKRFVVQFGLPTTEILDEYNQPFVFQMGQGVGLKNNSRNPKNNKIITRIAGYGSEDNIPYGYPQIPYYGGNVQYPLYYGIVGGQRVQLIKHPFTRNHLMPSVYSQSVYNKVNPKLSNGNNNPNYNPNIELVDYYDANDNTYTNKIKPNSPSYEIHEFGDIKPELGEKSIISAVPVSQQETQPDYKQKGDFLQEILDRISATEIEDEKTELLDVYDRVDAGLSYYKKHGEEGGDTYWYVFSITRDDYYEYVSYESGNYNFTATMLRDGSSAPTPDWDDTMDDDGNYLQSYFKITLPILEFDLYACAAITQEMKINMRSGACIGCTFPVEVDLDDYKRNFYKEDGTFDPVPHTTEGDGHVRDASKYPDSSSGQITVMVKKELETFGTLMPNQYQQPTTGDKFVILGISLPEAYITSAEQRLDTDMKQYMRDNNVYYFDYPLKFDEHFLISHEDILSQMKNNVVVRFNYAGTEHALYIKQMSVKYNESPLPKYDITLTDDIEIVLNQIGQVTDEVSKLRLGFGAGGFGTVGAEYIRKDIDDTARGTIRMIKGMQVGERFVTGLLGEGGVFRKDSDGTTYLETDKLYVRMKAYFDTVEVKHYLHTGGNRIASQASGIVCSRVEMIDAHNNLAMDVADAVLFRCFFKANDGDKTIRNDFMIGDLAFCRETNVDVSSVNLHGYWRLVIGRNYDGFLTENKEAWIDLSNRASDTITVGGRQYSCAGYQNGSDAPIAQDDIIQLGNIVDKDRQGAIVEYVGDEDAPSYQIFQGIGEDLPYPYTLENKNYIGLGYSSQTGRAYMNVYGDAYIGDPNETTYIRYSQGDGTLQNPPKLEIKAIIDGSSPIGDTDTTIEQALADLLDDITDLQSQIDGSIETFFNDYMPVAKTQEGAPANRVPLVTITIDGRTVPCEPYYSWYTADHGGTASEVNTERLKHLGDIFYDNTSGYAFRFSQDESTHVFEWVEITDSAVIKALRDAAEAYGLADTKNKIFTTVAGQLPPYPWKEGDLWVNATYPADGSTYSNDILKCKQDRTSDGSINDWTLASKYTDDKKVEWYTNILTGVVEIKPSESSEKEIALAAENAIRTALGGNFIIDGGLMLMSIIGMRKLNEGGDPSKPGDYTTWAGISGVYDDNLYGGGVAAWYGGGLVDKRNPTTGEYDVANGAKSGFRFDGSGWLADGNINWNAQGAMVIKNIETIYGTGNDSISINELSALTSIFHTETYGSGNITELLIKPQNAYSQLFINRSGNPLPASSYPQDHTINEYSVLNYGEMKARFVPLEFFNALFTAYSDANHTNAINPWAWTDTAAASRAAINNLKILVGTWTEQYLSALGHNSQQSGGGGIGDVTWEALASAGNQQINISHLSSAGVATQSWVRSQFGGSVMRVDVGTDKYLPSSGGVVSLPAYPTTLPASDVSAWAKADTKPTYAFNEITGSLTEADIPSLSWSKITTGKPTSWWGASSIDANGAVKGSMSNVGDIAFSESGKNIGGLLYFIISQTTPQIKVGSNATLVQYAYSNGTFTPKLYVDGYAGVNGEILAKGLELVGSGTTGNVHGGYIDFHYSESAADYTSRIIEKESGLIQLSTKIQTSRIYLYKPNANDTDAVYLECDTDHNVKLVGNFYATGAVSALGSNSQQGGGGGNVYWSQLTTGTGGQPIHASLLTNVTKTLSIYYDDNPAAITYNGKIVQTTPVLITKTYADGRYYQKIANGSASEVVLADGTKSKLKTVNGYSIFGEGNIDASGGGTGNYLPLAGGTLTGSLQIFSTDGGGGWNEGIRMHVAPDKWCGVVMCGDDNTGDSGTSAKTWGMHNHNGEFWINKNGSNAHTGNELCNIGGNWGVSTTNPQYKFHIDGTFYASGVSSFGGSLNAYGSACLYHYYNNVMRMYVGYDPSNQYAHLYTPNASIQLKDNGEINLTNRTIINSSENVLKLNSTSADNWIYFRSTIDGTLANRASVGYYKNFAFVANEKGYQRIGVADDGTPQYWANSEGTAKYTLYHSGNLTNVSQLTNDSGYITSSSNAATATKLQTARSLWGNSFNGTADISNNIHLYATDVAWGEGIRMHVAPDKWCGVVMCGDDNTGDSGTSAKTWGMHNHNGEFWINKNGSNAHTGNELCNIDGNWGIATTSPSYKLHVDGSFYATSGSINGNAIIHAGNIGSQSVSYATSSGKLAASVNLWGRPFDGSGSVSGDMSGVGNISMDNNKYICIGAVGASGANNKTGYISAGAGYSPNSGRYGVRILCCDQTDCQSGLGQDLAMGSGWSNVYNLSIAGCNSSTDYGYISFVTHKVNSTTYRYLGGFYDNAGTITFRVLGSMYTSGRASINTTATSGILTVSRGSTNDYAIDTLGQQRYKYDSGDTSSLSIGLLSSNKCPFIRFTDVLGGYIDVQMFPVVDSGGTVTGSIFSIGNTSHTSRVIARNFRVYTRISSDDSGNTQAMQALMNGRLLVGSADTTLANGNTDCKFLVNGNMCTSAANGSFIKIGNVYLIYDSGNNAIKVAGNAAGTTAANFYAMGAVSALGANTSSGGGITLNEPLNGINNSDLGAPSAGSMTGTAVVFNGTKWTYSHGSKLVAASFETISGGIKSYTTLTVNGAATIGGTATIGGSIVIGATEAVGTVSSKVIQTLNKRAIYIKTVNAPHYVDGTWSNTSDVRLKDIINNVGASVDQIANAPIFNYKWKSGGVSIMLGSSAQYWQKVFQHAVEIGPENYLYMDYSSVALASAVMVARKVQNHEDRILELERENEQLRNEIKQLKAA